MGDSDEPDDGASGDAEQPRVGVVGAGITGLSLTHGLADAGVESVTFEATGEAGGVIQSDVVDGRVLETGPQRIRLTDEIRGLIDDVGLASEVVEADDDLPLYVFANGALRLVPRSLGAFLRTDLLSWPGKLRVLAEPLTDDADGEETAAEVFTRKFGREAYENLISPIFGGTYGSDPARMPVKHALEPLLGLEAKHGNVLVPAAERILFSEGETPPPASFRSGMQRLPEALAEEHADRVRFETPVSAVEPTGDGVVRIATADGTETVDQAVLTTPAPVTADVVENCAPETAEALRELTYNSLVLVHLHAETDARGFGYQVRRSEPLRTLGVTWNDSLLGRDGVYTVFMGGMHDPGAMALTEDELGTIAASEFEQVMGEPAEILRVTKWEDAIPAYDESWAAMERVDLPEGIRLATNYTGRLGVPARVREGLGLAAEFAGEGDAPR